MNYTFVILWSYILTGKILGVNSEDKPRAEVTKAV